MRPPHLHPSTLAVVAAVLLAPAAAAFAQLGDDVPEEAKRLFRQALELNDRREYGTALSYFMKAYKLSADVLAADDRGLLNNAEAFLQARVDREPANAEASFQLAEVLVMRGRVDEGLKLYEAVIAGDPNGPLSVLARAEVDRLRQAAGAAPGPDSSVAGASGTSGTAAPAPGPSEEEGRLRDEVDRLEGEVKELKAKLEAQAEELEKAHEETKKTAAALEQLEKDAKQWKLYHNIYWSDPSRTGSK